MNQYCDLGRKGTGKKKVPRCLPAIYYVTGDRTRMINRTMNRGGTAALFITSEATDQSTPVSAKLCPVEFNLCRLQRFRRKAALVAW